MWYALRIGLAVLFAAWLPGFFQGLSDFVLGYRVKWKMDCSSPELPLPQEESPRLDELSLMHVVYATDGFDLMGLVISMVSLARHTSDPGQLAIHVIATDVAMPYMDDAVACFRRQLASDLPAVPSVSILQERPCNLSDGSSTTPFHAPHCSNRFCRYCLQQYLPSVPRALWIDTDTVVRVDVRRLYTMRMRYPLSASLATPYETLRDAGNRDGGLHWLAPHSNHLEVSLDSQVFNAGIMVVDLTKWRSGRITDALFRWLDKMGRLCTNQLALNVFFRSGGFDLIDWRWNVMVPKRVGLPSQCLEEAHIVHWAGFLKHWSPWGWWMHPEIAEPYLPKGCALSRASTNG